MSSIGLCNVPPPPPFPQPQGRGGLTQNAYNWETGGKDYEGMHEGESEGRPDTERPWTPGGRPLCASLDK